MTDRDTFAAAALTGLLEPDDATSDTDWWKAQLCRKAYEWADAMLRERAAGEKHRAWVAQNASLVAAAQAPTKPRTPQSDRLTEWERHGSHRWGLGVASDLYDLECRVAALEKAIHDAALAATAVSTDDRTDKAAPAQCRDRPGDTPAKTDTTHPRNGAVDTPKAQTTPAECSKTREGTEPVAWAVVYPNGEVAVIAFKLQDAEERATASDRIVPLYRSPTLTDAERAAIASAIADDEAATAYKRAATLRGLLERLGGGR